MIKVSRTKKPPVLQSHGRDWKNAILSATTDEDRRSAQGKYANPEIRVALEYMFSHKCAYCESVISHISYAHIEHFKPKSVPRYYPLAISWPNLLLACGRCNGAENKGDKFPLAREGGPIVNPTTEDPSLHFRFEFDHATGLANVLGKTKRGVTTENLLGLNRRMLLQRRSKAVKKLVFIAKSYKTDPEAKILLDAAAAKDEEYSAFAKDILANI